MGNKHDEEFFDSVIKRAGFCILEAAVNELPSKDEAAENVGDMSDLDGRMNRIFNREQARARWRKARNIALKAAVAILAVIVVSCVAVASSEALRVQVLNMFLSSNDGYTEITFSEDEQGQMPGDTVYAIYVPQGFELVESREMPNMYVVVYRNQAEDRIIVERFGINTQFSVDNERHENKEITIAGIPAFASEGEGESSLIFHSDSYAFHIGGDIVLEECIKMAESLLQQP